MIGLLASGNGAIGPLHWLAGVGVDPGSMIGNMIAAGGSAGGGGGGGWNDFFRNLFFYGTGLLVLGLVVGIVIGFGVQLLLFAVAGAAKGAAKDYIEHILEDATKRGETPYPKFVTGTVRGAIAGTVTGVLCMIFTALGASKFVS